jgi:hypothetical protein
VTLLAALWGLIADLVAFFWYSFVEPPVREERDVAPASQTPTEIDPPIVNPGGRHVPPSRVPSMFLRNAAPDVEDGVNEQSFLAQLEQRTQQVKITLANLEAEKVRIEGLIAQIEPVVPHYDALLEAERAISTANIAIEAAHAAPRSDERQHEDEPPEPSWEEQHEAGAQSWP